MFKPTEEQIETWKKERGSVFKCTIGDTEYYYTTITRDQYLGILEKQQEAEATGTKVDNELETVMCCILNTSDPTEISRRAGVASVLSEKILVRSGFSLDVKDEEC